MDGVVDANNSLDVSGMQYKQRSAPCLVLTAVRS